MKPLPKTNLLFTTQMQGRADAERNDCTVVGFMTVTGITYAEASKAAFSCGRVMGKGFWTESLVAYGTSKMGMKFTEVNLKEEFNRDSITLKRFCRKMPKGRFIARYRGHCLAIIDGVIHDRFESKVGKRLLRVWQFHGTNA